MQMHTALLLCDRRGKRNPAVFHKENIRLRQEEVHNSAGRGMPNVAGSESLRARQDNGHRFRCPLFFYAPRDSKPERVSVYGNLYCIIVCCFFI